MNMKKILISMFIFCSAGLFGPAIRIMTSLYQKFDNEISMSVYRFIYGLVIYTWPTQQFAVIDVNVGWFLATVLAIGLNILLFGFLGLIVALCANSKTRMIGIYIFVCILVFIFAFWGAGFSIFYLNWFAFIMTLFLYAIPFYLFWRLVKIRK
jgi:hypothetical protein